MTDRLAEIEQQAHESSIDSIGPADVAWLIAEVKRLRREVRGCPWGHERRARRPPVPGLRWPT
jgi:hypothetical protein